MVTYSINAAVLFTAIFVGWCLLNIIISRLTGWAAIGEKYAVREKPNGEWFRFATVGFTRWSGYNGCITACVGELGLYIAVFFPFRPGHPPLLIPWHAMLHVCQHKIGFFNATRVSLQEFQQDLYLRGSLGEAVLDFAHMKGFSENP